MSEADLAKKMAKVIRDRGGWSVKTHGDPRQRRGLPDILACYRGQFIGIEVKLPGKERNLTAIQAATLKSITDAGGLYGHVLTTVAQVRGLLNYIDMEIDSADAFVEKGKGAQRGHR